MSELRLSRLQKWILLRISESDWIENRRKWISRRQIFKEFYNLDIMDYYVIPAWPQKVDNSKSVVVSRSLRNLEEKGLIHLERWTIRQGYWNPICLTNNGRKKSKHLRSRGFKSVDFIKK